VIPGFPSIGGGEILILLAIVLLFFGAKRIPELARSLGRGTHEFRKGISEGPAEVEGSKQKEQEDPNLDDTDEGPKVESEPTPTGQKS
jgi:sec-independent protein translocase protein TatA